MIREATPEDIPVLAALHVTRLIPLHASTTDMLKGYAQLRDRFHPASATEAFFVTFRGVALQVPTVGGVFRHLRAQLSWAAGGGRRPRIHDLRHTFACRWLMRWYEEGVDLDHRAAEPEIEQHALDD